MNLQIHECVCVRVCGHFAALRCAGCWLWIICEGAAGLNVRAAVFVACTCVFLLAVELPGVCSSNPATPRVRHSCGGRLRAVLCPDLSLRLTQSL